ncbi:thiamine ABC transporter substrate-binding protein [Actinopolyspora erythraea]|uniref:ABC transporter substrate-binding protein n=1 Tax=Actinopolyspora erythraea TaxID=414996 RepID=A0A099D1H5_9ACTN|nr:thiamine ABC transporter substrate-binding protein [Actinopolyspora erythraea]ASU79815.1 thiamine ABC transporter substrate-binding protein [Actinopolyspora erythraea]KGI79667.1 ABC transporter substrate-binding protein [Actinopolyspora erythraea]
MRRSTARRTRAALAVAVTLLIAGCSLTGTGRDPENRTVTLVTHDSFAMSDELRQRFERDSGFELRILRKGDAGELTNELVLTRDAPIGDVAFGVDSTYLSRALDEDVFASYRPEGAAQIPIKYAFGANARPTPVDAGDVCLNIDLGWFEQHDVPPPEKLADLVEPRYRGLFAVPNPATSSPGLAFLLNTVDTFGEPGWRNYWRQLLDNDARISSGWQEAYNQDFSGSSGEGPRPIVLSYASSPAAEIGPDGQPRTRALLDTCYRQVEYAGVLNGTDTPKGARELMDFMLSWKFQSRIPEQMYVYPVVMGVELPESWQRAAPLPESSNQMKPERVERNRAEWIRQWRSLATG